MAKLHCEPHSGFVVGIMKGLPNPAAGLIGGMNGFWLFFF